MEVIWKNDTKLLFIFKRDTKTYKEVYVKDEFIWSELTSTLESQGAKVAASFFPPEAQLEVFYHGACRRARIPSVPGNVYNLGQTHHTMKTLDTDTIVTTARLAEVLLGEYPSVSDINTLILVGLENEDTKKRLQEKFSISTIEFVRNPFDNLVS